MQNSALENEVLQLHVEKERENKEEGEIFLPISPSSTPFQSLSNMQSFTEENLLSEPSEIVKNDDPKAQYSLPEISHCNISLTFTSQMADKLYLIMKNQFRVLFKIAYPDTFFDKVYKSDYYTILGIDKPTKELLCFAVLDIQQKRRYADILAFGVVKEYQNKKLGTALLQKIIEELMVMGIKRVGLIVQQVNDIAFKLYKKFGFKVEMVLSHYYNFEEERERGAFLMKKNIIPDCFWIYEVFKRITNRLFCGTKKFRMREE